MTGSAKALHQTGFQGGAGSLVIFNIMSCNLFSAVIDLGREHTGMLFIQTLQLSDRCSVLGRV